MSIRKVFLDTETTGLSPTRGDRIIEIGCIEVIDREITGEKFQVYLNPERPNSERSIEITGLTDDFLSQQVKFEVIFQDLIQFIRGSEIIIHNARFDESFLNAEFERIEPNMTLRQLAPVTCSLEMARLKRPGQKNNLDALCRAYRIDNQHRKYHGALLDAELTAQVYLAMTAGQVSLPLFQVYSEQKTISKNTRIPVESSNVKQTLIKIFANPEELQAHHEWFL